MFENVGGGEILLIMLVILIFFGPKKIPELAQSLGKGLRKFNEAKEGLETHVKTAMKEPLDALNSAKQGFETKLREVAEPLHAELKIPLPPEPAIPAARPVVAETQPRGTLPEPTLLEPPVTPVTPATEVPAKEA